MTSETYRMIAIDLDGTLLCPQGKVSERVAHVIRQIAASGTLVCFATGRNFTESRPIIEAVRHFGAAVFVGGAMVIDTLDRQTLHCSKMDPQLARDVCGVLQQAGHAVLALQDTENAGVDYLINRGTAVNESTRQWLKVTRATVHWMDDLSSHRHDHTVRVGLVAEPEEIVRIKALLAERFEGRRYVQSIKVPAYGVEVLEVFDPSVNKWQGLQCIARKHGIQPEQIIAIGDDVNDIEMLRKAGLGVAMGNAAREIQAVADRVIGHNGQEGLAVFLEELLKNNFQVLPETADAVT